MTGGDGGTAKPGREWTRGRRVFGRPRVRRRIARTRHATGSFMPALGFSMEAGIGGGEDFGRGYEKGGGFENDGIKGTRREGVHESALSFLRRRKKKKRLQGVASASAPPQHRYRETVSLRSSTAVFFSSALQVLSVYRPASTGHFLPSFRPLSTGSTNPIQSNAAIFYFTQHDGTA